MTNPSTYGPPPQRPAPPGYAYPPPPPPVSPGGQRLAEFTDRLAARVIDSVIVGGVISVVVVPIYLFTFLSIFEGIGTTVYTERDPFGDQPTQVGNPFAVLLPLFGVLALLFVLSLLLAYLYEVEMMFRSGQTLGKRVMKIKVIPVDPAETLTRAQAVKRFLVQHVAAAFLPGLNWIDGLWQLWDKPYRQCLHDKFATTLVIKLNP